MFCECLTLCKIASSDSVFQYLSLCFVSKSISFCFTDCGSFCSGGCTSKVQPDGAEQPAHVCPRCSNGSSQFRSLVTEPHSPPAASVFAAKSKTWLECFFIPLVPLSSKHIWLCGICQWASPLGAGWVQSLFSTNALIVSSRHWEPPIAYQTPQHSGFGGYNAGYQPSYGQPPNQK